MSSFWTAVAALVPSVGVGLIFWYAMRAVVRADRNERIALERLDRETAAANSGQAPESSGPAGR